MEVQFIKHYNHDIISKLLPKYFYVNRNMKIIMNNETKIVFALHAVVVVS